MATKKRRYQDRGKITRTLLITDFDITFFDRETEEIRKTHYSIPRKLTEKEMLSVVSDVGVGLKIENAQVTEALYVCDLDEFLRVATKVETNE